MSLGEDRVRVKFNPSNDTVVDAIKQGTAALINVCEDGKHTTGSTGESIRLWSLAQTHYEEAAMWAVKAATSP